MKKISVVIPMFNAEKYVAQTILSVLSQSYLNTEVLIVDDGSTDRSVEICKHFLDSRIKIISQENRGLAGARNTGIRHASGDYIALIDADDLWLFDKLEKHVKHLDQADDVGISFSYSSFINEEGQEIGLRQTSRSIRDITPACILCRNPIGNGSTPVIRRQVFEDIKFQDDRRGAPETFYFDEGFSRAEDIECWMRIAIQTSWKIEGIPEVLTLYRLTSSGLSSNVLDQVAALNRVTEKARSWAPDLIAECEGAARAYHLRYAARRMVTLKDGVKAACLINQAIKSHWRILIEEPHRTILTLTAAYSLLLLPSIIHENLQSLALKLAKEIQRFRSSRRPWLLL